VMKRNAADRTTPKSNCSGEATGEAVNSTGEIAPMDGGFTREGEI